MGEPQDVRAAIDRLVEEFLRLVVAVARQAAFDALAATLPPETAARLRARLRLAASPAPETRIVPAATRTESEEAARRRAAGLRERLRRIITDRPGLHIERARDHHPRDRAPSAQARGRGARPHRGPEALDDIPAGRCGADHGAGSFGRRGTAFPGSSGHGFVRKATPSPRRTDFTQRARAVVDAVERKEFSCLPSLCLHLFQGSPGSRCPTPSGWRGVRGSMVDPTDPALPGLPPADVHREIRKQNTDVLRKKAKRYAEARMPMVRRAGLPAPKNYANELVDDAITDTWLGDAPWDPASCDLLVHLRGVIKTRTWLEIRRAFRFERLSIDVPEDHPTWSTDIEPALAQASFGICRAILLCGLTATICAELRRIDLADQGAHDMLECWENGFVEREQVMILTGMDENFYKATRKRILGRVKHLPAELLDVALDLLRRAS